MLHHIFLSVSDLHRSVDFYTLALAPLGITHQHDYAGKDGPPGHPDLKGFGARGRVFSGCDKALPTLGPFISVSWGLARPRSMRLTPPPWPLVLPTTGHPVRDCTTTRATTRPTCWTRMATASNSSTRAGSTRNHEKNSFHDYGYDRCRLASAARKLAAGFINPSHGQGRR